MAEKSVLIVDYGVGNLFNVARAFTSLGASPRISSDPDEIRNADRILLPGVGAFAAGMAGLGEHGLVEVLQEVARKGSIPLLGICLGMQLLMESSEENGLWDGLKIIPGSVKRFSPPGKDQEQFKIPQIGWNTLEVPIKRSSSGWKNTILHQTAPGSFMYFVHSYHVVPADAGDTVAQTQYGNDRFCSVINRGSVWGCQFHPERSGEQGLAVLKAFLNSSL